eukprot:2854983-Rhodomonas_salina.3
MRQHIIVVHSVWGSGSSLSGVSVRWNSDRDKDMWLVLRVTSDTLPIMHAVLATWQSHHHESESVLHTSRPDIAESRSLERQLPLLLPLQREA